jgi:hypothetical protein
MRWALICTSFLRRLVVSGSPGSLAGFWAVALSLTGIFRPLPKHVVAAALIGYVIIAAFYAWREQYHAAARLDTPLQKRKKLDSLVKEGERLLNLFEMGKSPEALAERWENMVINFVGQNFTLTEYDKFKWCTLGVEKVISMRIDVHDDKRKAVANQIDGRLQGLRELRDSMRD